MDGGERKDELEEGRDAQYSGISGGDEAQRRETPASVVDRRFDMGLGALNMDGLYPWSSFLVSGSRWAP